jgi:hypothetical protein
VPSVGEAQSLVALSRGILRIVISREADDLPEPTLRVASFYLEHGQNHSNAWSWRQTGDWAWKSELWLNAHLGFPVIPLPILVTRSVGAVPIGWVIARDYGDARDDSILGRCQRKTGEFRNAQGCNRPALPVSVECYAGHRGEETPTRFRLGDRPIEVEEVLDRWLAPDHRYFKVQTGDGIYILRNDVTSDVWELTMFERGANPQAESDS